MPVEGHKFVFYHMPRSGGTSLGSALKEAGLTWNVLNGRHSLPPEHLNPKKVHFTIWRDPFDWLASMYTLLKGLKHPVGGMPARLMFSYRCRMDGFEIFVQDMIKRKPGAVTEIYHAYAPAEMVTPFMWKGMSLALWTHLGSDITRFPHYGHNDHVEQPQWTDEMRAAFREVEPITKVFL